jgi:dTDP-4-amino-4,6-dideoxygalactose transaminase
MIRFLDLASQYRALKPEIDAAIADTIADAAFIGGKALKQFESAFAAFQQAEHCIGVGNGTDSLEIVLEAFDLPEGSEVIVPANTFISSSEAVTRSGHRVVFADVDPATYTMTVDTITPHVTERTGAIMLVHLYGYPAPVDEIVAWAGPRSIRVLEDSAQAHGAEIGGRRIGAIGDAGSFSFYPGKNLGAYGDGGAIVTNDVALAERCRMIANHGRLKKYDHAFEGRNSRLDGLQAAILNAKLPHLDGWVDQRNAIARAYLEGLSGVPGITLPTLPGNGRHAFHLFVIRTDRRDELQTFLGEREIQTGIHYPIALPKLGAYDYLGMGQADFFANRTDTTLLSLPIGEHLSVEDAATVVDAVKAFALVDA